MKKEFLATEGRTRYYQNVRVFECIPCRLLVAGEPHITEESCSLCGRNMPNSRPIEVLILRGIHRPMFSDGKEEKG